MHRQIYEVWIVHDDYVEEIYVTAELYEEGYWNIDRWHDMPAEIELVKDPEWTDILAEDVEGYPVTLDEATLEQVKADLSELYWDEEPWKYEY